MAWLFLTFGLVGIVSLFFGGIPITIVCTILNIFIGLHWFRIDWIGGIKRLGKKTGTSVSSNMKALPDHMQNLNASNILQSIEKKFCKIAENAGVELNDFRRAVLSANHNRKMKIRRFVVCRMKFICPVKLIHVKNDDIFLEINQEFASNKKSFLESIKANLKHSRMYLLSGQIANQITGAMLRNWLNTILTNNQETRTNINHVIEKYDVNNIIKAFMSDYRAIKIVQNELLHKSDCQIIIDNRVVQEGPNPDIGFVDELDIEIEEQDFSTNDLEKESDQLVDSGSLEDT